MWNCQPHRTIHQSERRRHAEPQGAKQTTDTSGYLTQCQFLLSCCGWWGDVDCLPQAGNPHHPTNHNMKTTSAAGASSQANNNHIGLDSLIVHEKQGREQEMWL